VHKSKRYSTSCQTFALKGDHLMQSLFAFDPSSYSGLWALADRAPPLSESPTQENVAGVRSGDRKAKKWTPPPPSADPSLRHVVTSLRIWGGATSCWKSAFGLFWCSWGINHNCNMWWLISRDLTSVLYSSGKRWNYFLRMRAWKQFLIALYSVLRLILVWLVLANKFM
jgi:hypothetical protein